MLARLHCPLKGFRPCFRATRLASAIRRASETLIAGNEPSPLSVRLPSILTACTQDLVPR